MRAIFKGKIVTIPNLLTTVRILLIPVLLWVALAKDDMRATVILLLLSGLTDILDGWIARHFDCISDLGKALDPVADKLTQLAMLICLLFRFPRMLILIIVLCVKEIFVASTQLLVIHRTEVVLGADWHGKLTTTLLYGVMLLHLLWLDLPKELSFALEMLCIGMLLLSGVLYGLRNIRAAKAARLNAAEETGEQIQEEAS